MIAFIDGEIQMEIEIRINQSIRVTQLKHGFLFNTLKSY